MEHSGGGTLQISGTRWMPKRELRAPAWGGRLAELAGASAVVKACGERLGGQSHAITKGALALSSFTVMRMRCVRMRCAILESQ